MAEDSKSVHSRDYQEVVDANNFLVQELEEFKLAASQANDGRLKVEQAKKNALEQLHILRQESEIQREDLRSAEAATKKAWKIVGDATAKSSAQAKELKEAQDAKLELSSKMTALQRKLDELKNSTKLGSVEKNRLETEISTLSRRLKMEEEMTRRAEADLTAKNRELLEVKGQNVEFSQAKLAAVTDQKEKLETALRDWQAKHADVASRLDASETHKSRAILEIEDLVSFAFHFTDNRIMNLLDLSRLGQLRNGLPPISRFVHWSMILIAVNVIRSSSVCQGRQISTRPGGN